MKSALTDCAFVYISWKEAQCKWVFYSENDMKLTLAWQELTEYNVRELQGGPLGENSYTMASFITRRLRR